MDRKQFSYTPPGQIEGEPGEVVELSTRQLAALAGVVGELTTETYTQLRAAGVGDKTLEEWKDSEDGRKADDLAWAAKVFVEAVAALSGAD